jgi:coenzyme PQQ precursor peptide PqqA
MLGLHAPSGRISRGQAWSLSRSSSRNQELETIMNEWLKPHIEETQAGMEVTSYLPAELGLS